MGRTLESLRQGDGQRSGFMQKPHDAMQPPHVPPPAGEPAPEADTEEFPFIEVGGSGKKLDGSPSVLAVPLPPRRPKDIPRPPVQPTAVSTPLPASASVPVLQPAPLLVATGCETRPLTVTLEHWPAGRSASPRVAREIIAYHQPEHPVAKQYAALFAKMVQDLPGEAVVLFTGAKSRSGTTTVLLNLAFAGAAGERRRMILVDGNLHKPALAQRLGLDASPGLTEVLAGKMGLEQVLRKTAHPLVEVVSAQPLAQPPRRDALHWILAWLVERFGLVLVDAPSLEDVGSLEILASAGAGVYLVLPHGDQEASLLGMWAQTITGMGARLHGLIRTHFD